MTQNQSRLKENVKESLHVVDRQRLELVSFLSFPVLTLLVMTWQKERGNMPYASPLSSGGNSNLFCSFAGYIEKH